MTVRLLAAVVLALALPATALASEQRPTLAELERELICPTCLTTLGRSSSVTADRMRSFIRARIAAGDTKSEIKDKLVAEFGERILAAPPSRGFNLLAWLLPIGGIALAAAVVGMLAWRWSRAPRLRPGEPSADGRAPLAPELERRLDEELARFDA
jgi:cytochrome c-type biogenesis protein CcmH